MSIDVTDQTSNITDLICIHKIMNIKLTSNVCVVYLSGMAAELLKGLLVQQTSVLTQIRGLSGNGSLWQKQVKILRGFTALVMIKITKIT